MAMKKAGEVEAFLSRPDFSFPVILLYGPDAGLVSERAALIAAQSGIDPSDPFATATLSAEDAERDIGRLFDEMGTISMFGGRRLVRVRGAGGTARALSEAVADLGKNPPKGALLVIEAGDLKKSAALRLAAEKASAAMALPCFQDEGRSLDRMIDEELKIAHLKIEPAAREMLRARLGADRRLSRGEVQKLCLYAYGMETITEDVVGEIVGDVSADTLEETIDAAVNGEVRRLPHLIDRLVHAGTALFQVQQSLLRYFQQLQAMRELVEARGDTVARVVERARPHFRRKTAMETALTLWTLDAITGMLARIEADILAARREAGLAEATTRRLLLDVAVETARLRLRGGRR